MRFWISILTIFFLTACLEQGKKLEMTETPSLSPDHPPLPPANPIDNKLVVIPRTLPMGGRGYVASVFRNIFTDSATITAANLKTFNDLLDTTLTKAITEFGGALNLYSSRGLREDFAVSCNTSCTTDNYQDLPPYSPSTPARLSVSQTTCHKLLDNNLYLTEALKKIQITATPPTAPAFNKDLLADIYELFYLDDQIPQEVVEALNVIIDSAKSKGFSNLEQWRTAFVLICETPEWHSL